MLNSRPLALMSTDEAEEGSFLTAGHFLNSRPIQTQPSRQPSTGKISLLKRWNLVSRIRSDLWKTWSSSYCSSCAQRSRWTHSGHQLRIGDVVFTRDETLRARDWPIAMVTANHPGDDGVTRTATIRCRGRTYKRPTVKLILAITDQDSKTSPPSGPGVCLGFFPRQSVQDLQD